MKDEDKEAKDIVDVFAWKDLVSLDLLLWLDWLGSIRQFTPPLLWL